MASAPRACARQQLRALTVLSALAAARAVAAPSPARPPGEVLESAAERRAVRGAPIDDAVVQESPELREVRRFEGEAFPRQSFPSPRQDTDTVPLPPGLQGRWGGSGDLPLELRSPTVARPVSRAPASPEAEWLRQLVLPELPVRWEPQVIRFLQYFKNDPKGRGVMASLLRRMERYRGSFERILVREGVPKDLMYLAMFESGFEPGAVSRVGAGGIWQFMPGAGRAYGLEVSHWVDARRDPERATEAAARYLKDLYVRFASWPLAFAAYHAGYGAVLRSIARYNTNDYWEMCKHEAGLPWETTLYVPRIIAGAIIGHNRAAFGFGDVLADPPWEHEQIEALPGTALASVARAAGTRPEAIEALNPELVRGRTPPDRAARTVRVPIGSATLYAETAGSGRLPAEPIETVVLRFGETMDDVARARGLALRDLKKLNGVKDTAEVRPGTMIVAPVRGAIATRSADVPAAEVDDTVLVAVPDKELSYDGRDRVFYRTREGDTIDEVAGVFRVSIDELVEWNNLDPEAKLHPKLVLQMFVRKELDFAGVSLLDPAKVRVVTLGSEEFLELEAARRGKTRLQYVARSGDSLAKIARRYGLQPGDLARINRFSSNTELSAGQPVIVYSPTPGFPRELAVGRSVPHRRPTTTAGAMGKPAVSRATSPPKPLASVKATKVVTAPAAPAKPPTKALPTKPTVTKKPPAVATSPVKR